MLDLLRILLKSVSEQEDVAAKLIASGDDLEQLARDDAADIPALSGWRYEIFGHHALRLKQGELGLSIYKNRLKIIEL